MNDLLNGVDPGNRGSGQKLRFGKLEAFGGWPAFAIVAVYALVTLVGVLNHEPWRDEAHGWLVARDAGLRPLLAHMAQYGGTPATWSLLQYALVQAGFGYQSLFVLHWAIAVGAIAVFVFRSPFSLVTKALVPFSFLMAYEYVVVARHYALGILVLFLVVAVYPKRHDRSLLYAALVFLLFNTNTHMFGAAVFFLLAYLLELWRRRPNETTAYIAATVMLLGLAVFVIQVAPSGDSAIRAVTAVAESPRKFAELMILSITDGFLPTVPPLGRLVSVVLLGSTGLFLLLGAELLRSRVAFAFLVTTSGWLFYIFTRVYYGDTRHHGLLFISVLAAYWLALGSPTTLAAWKARPWFLRPVVGLNLIAAFSVPFAARAYAQELRGSFSGAQEAARFLVAEDLDSRTIVAYPSWIAEAVLPYLSVQRLWYPDKNDFGSYMVPDDRYFSANYHFVDGNLEIRITGDDVIASVDQRFADDPCVILLLGRALDTKHEARFEKIFQTSRRPFSAKDEVYFIYRRRSETPATSDDCRGPA